MVKVPAGLGDWQAVRIFGAETQAGEAAGGGAAEGEAAEGGEGCGEEEAPVEGHV